MKPKALHHQKCWKKKNIGGYVWRRLSWSWSRFMVMVKKLFFTSIPNKLSKEKSKETNTAQSPEQLERPDWAIRNLKRTISNWASQLKNSNKSFSNCQSSRARMAQKATSSNPQTNRKRTPSGLPQVWSLTVLLIWLFTIKNQCERCFYCAPAQL